MIFTARQLQKKCQEQNVDRPLHDKDATIIHLFKRKGNPQVWAIIETSLYCQLLGRSLLGSY